MRYTRLAAVLLVSAVPVCAQTRPMNDSAFRNSFSMRVLQLLQGFQMATTPEVAGALNALLTDTSAHMRMAPAKVATAADSTRAATIVKTARAGLEKYKDVSVAEREGYIKFLPWLEDQPIYHYNNIQNVLASVQQFDATKPVSLLYKKDAAGKMSLVGAMYSSAVGSVEDMDARLPLGIAHWHEHVDFCSPSPDSIRVGAQKLDPASTAKWLAISTREGCNAVGGRFVPRVFGWMAHVYLFADTDDPKVIWGEEHSSMNVHVHPKP
jgi:hypothetical protein